MKHQKNNNTYEQETRGKCKCKIGFPYELFGWEILEFRMCSVYLFLFQFPFFQYCPFFDFSIFLSFSIIGFPLCFFWFGDLFFVFSKCILRLLCQFDVNRHGGGLLLLGPGSPASSCCSEVT